VNPVKLDETCFPASDYDLEATLASGQAFRWRRNATGWQGVVSGRFVQLRIGDNGIVAQAPETNGDWTWLEEYLQAQVEMARVLVTFPDDEPMQAAIRSCRGLRLLRQEPWECLASFILSSTKQIVQIQQIVGLLCERLGASIAVPPGQPAVHSFPSVERIARCEEAELRACKMGFRAPYLLGTARMLQGGEVNLERLRTLSCAEARAELVRLPGVGRKIADCVLLFAYGFQEAFPVDVWVLKALRQLYFPKRRVSPKRLLRFTETHFGPNAGYAQQYLFHYVRTKNPLPAPAKRRRKKA
jgi:N-glycosylase/DNA lyase